MRAVITTAVITLALLLSVTATSALPFTFGTLSDPLAEARKTTEGKRYEAEGKNPFVESFKNHAMLQADDTTAAEKDALRKKVDNYKPYVGDVTHVSHQDHLIRECFCWNEEQNEFCGGSKWYQSDACNKWFAIAMAWAVPAMLMVFFFFVFPLLFCCSRMLCNCCGGRNPSYGCCCAETHAEHRFPGYSNRSIFCTKLGFFVCFGFLIYFSVGTIITNVHLHDAFTTGLSDVVNIVDDVVREMDKVEQAYQIFANSPLPYSGTTSAPTDHYLASAASVAKAQEEMRVFQPRAHDINHVVHKIREAERNNSYGRYPMTFRLISIPMFIFLFLAVMACCGRCYGWCTSMFVLLVSWGSICVVALFLFHMLWAQGATAICNNYNATFVPVVVGAVRSGGGCGSAGSLTAVGANFMDIITDENSLICTELITPLCSHKADSSIPADFACPATNPCRKYTWAPGTYPLTVVNSTVPNQANVGVFDVLMTQSKLGNTTQVVRDDPMLAGISILDCATRCPPHSDIRKTAEKLAHIYTKFYANVSYVTLTALPDFFNCSDIKRQLTGPVHHTLCGPFDRWSTNIAIQTCASSCVLLVSLIFIVLGIKRFRPLGSREKLSEVAIRSIYAADASLNGVETPASPVVPVTPMDIGSEGRPVNYGTAHDTDIHYRAYADQHVVEAVPLMRNESMQQRYYPPNSSMAGRPADLVYNDNLESKA